MSALLSLTLTTQKVFCLDRQNRQLAKLAKWPITADALVSSTEPRDWEMNARFHWIAWKQFPSEPLRQLILWSDATSFRHGMCRRMLLQNSRFKQWRTNRWYRRLQCQRRKYRRRAGRVHRRILGLRRVFHIMRSVAAVLYSSYILFSESSFFTGIHGCGHRLSRQRQELCDDESSWERPHHDGVRAQERCTRPGPKSGSVSCAMRVPFVSKILFLISAFDTLDTGTGVRVARGTTARAEGGLQSAEVCRSTEVRGEQVLPQARLQPQSFSRARKRSFKRACRRAWVSEERGTNYRGRWHTHQQLLHSYRPGITIRSTTVCRPRARQPRSRRLKIFTWNVGGMAEKWDALMHFADSSDFDVLMISESRWKFTSEWTSPRWWMLHNGCEDEEHQQGGILFLVSKRLCGCQEVQVRHILPGRLSHLRIQRSNDSIDLLGLYQKAWNCKDPKTRPQRRIVWNALRDCLRAIPWRNKVVLMGDFNTSCGPRGSCFGPFAVKPTSGQADDHERFVDIASEADLIALNTWTKQRDNCTFVFGDRIRTQIDYILVRSKQADHTAREASVMYDFPLAECSQGARHYPIVASIPIAWYPPTSHCNKQIENGFDREALIADLRNEEKQEPRLIQLQNRVAQEIQKCPDLESVHEALIRIGAQVYPKTNQVKLRTWQQPESKFKIQNMWNAFREMRKRRGGGMQEVIRAWREWSHFQKMYKAYQEHTKKLRRQRVHDIMERAQISAQKHDQRGLYQAVYELAPKKAAKQRKKIRDKNGGILSASAMAQELVKHFRERFQSRDARELELHASTRRLQHAVPLGRDALQDEFGKIPFRKAVPKHLAPGVLWRACRHSLSHKIDSLIASMWVPGPARIPRLWTDAWLFFLQKPAKSGEAAKHYRPIGLQCPAGKVAISIIAKRLKPRILDWLRPKPQFGYFPGRDTYGALRRVFKHCCGVRELCQSYAHSIHDLKAGKARPSCVGGLQILLDLEQAFDRLPRTRILQALERAGAASDEAELLLQWHLSAQYHVPEATSNDHFRATRGVRQGCKAAPLIWLCFSGLIMEALDSRNDAGWTSSHLTVFADDHHAGFIFRNEDELRQCLKQVAVLFAVLEEYGMSISTDKTVAIFTYRGTKREQIRKQYTYKTKDGRMLKISHAYKNYAIPIVSEHVYLGCVVTYASYEAATLQHRLSVGKERYRQLHKVLNSRKVLGRSHRLNIWFTCIWSSMQYGLIASGVLATGLKELQTVMMKHVRAISAMPAHLTHVSDSELCSKLGISLPGTMLLRSVETTRTRLRQNLINMSAQERSLHCEGWLQTVRELIAASKHGIQQLASDASLASAFSCDTCGLSFPTQKALRVHEWKEHGRILQTTAKFRKDVHAKGDMPICSGCNKVFTRWAGLERHINNNRCEQPVQEELENKPDSVGSVQLQLEQPLHTQSSAMLGKTPADMLNVPGLAKRLTQNCAFCKQWVASAYMVKNHYRNSHAKLVEEFHDKAVSLSKQQWVGVPCPFCESKTKARHSGRCTVLYQWHMLQLYWQGLKNESGGVGRSIWTAGASNANANNPTRKPPPDQGHATLSQRQRTQSTPSITRQRTRSTDGDSGENTSTARGEHQRDPPEHRVHGLFHDPKRFAFDSTSVAQGLSCLETGPRQRHRLRSKQNPAQGCAHAMPRESSPRSAKQRGPAEACTGSKLDDSQPRVDVSDVGWEGQNVEGGQHTFPHPPQRDATEASHIDANLGVSGGSTPVQKYQTASGEHGGKRAALSVGLRPHLANSYGSSTNAEGTHRQLSVSGDRGANPKANSAAIAAGSDATPVLARILRLELGNTSQTCYVNSVFWAYTWNALHIRISQEARFGHATEAIARVLKQRQANLVRMTTWRAIFAGWPSIGEQHDAIEFLGHFLQFARPMCWDGEWQARTVDDDGMPHVQYRESTLQAISLVLAEGSGPHSIQELVNAWHAQADVHALSQVPQGFCLQLQRFRVRDGRTVKQQVRVSWGNTVQVPCYVSGRTLEIQWRSYRVGTCILHHGATPTSGHYTSLMAQADGWLRTDDYQVPQPVSRITAAHEREVYALLLRLDE